MVKTRKDRLTDAEKLSMMNDFIKLEDLKVNKEHLRQLVAKYGPLSYDILVRANLGPQRLMHVAVHGHEAEFAGNPIVEAYLADKKSITPDKALEFFATEPVSKDLVADLNLRNNMHTTEYLAKHRAEQGSKTATPPNQEKKNEGSRAAQSKQTTKKTNTKSTPIRDGGR